MHLLRYWAGGLCSRFGILISALGAVQALWLVRRRSRARKDASFKGSLDIRAVVGLVSRRERTRSPAGRTAASTAPTDLAQALLFLTRFDFGEGLLDRGRESPLDSWSRRCFLLRFERCVGKGERLWRGLARREWCDGGGFFLRLVEAREQDLDRHGGGVERRSRKRAQRRTFRCERSGP